MFSPRLYRIYSERKEYEPGRLERWGDQIINSLYVLWNVGLYSSPVIAIILYSRKSYLITDGMLKIITGIGIALAASYFIRSIGRANSPIYTKFIETLHAAKKDLNKDTKKELLKYDFEYFAWPVEYKSESSIPKDTAVSSRRSIFTFPCQVLSYAITWAFGLKLMYPGSFKILQHMLKPVLSQGRAKLVNENHGERFKILTKDGNEIDTMFVDRRREYNKENGRILVLCSEGNAGFYEIGIMTTPIDAGYSVLGWNHPGFAGSTGYPYPSQELHAADAVMQFAINHLKFYPENIVLFGWSIGGFPTTWLAKNYPVKGVILDATFDDVTELAVTKMPKLLEPIIRTTIREQLYLNNYNHLEKYNGPIKIIRRTEDEVICTEDMVLATNRGNNLVMKLLKFRYPWVIDDAILLEWLAANPTQQAQIWSRVNVDENLCTSLMRSFLERVEEHYPMHFGKDFTIDMKVQMTLFLVSKHLADFQSSHCTPLPKEMFQLPWEVSFDSDFERV